jgi:hypothetical protein
MAAVNRSMSPSVTSHKLATTTVMQDTSFDKFSVGGQIQSMEGNWTLSIGENQKRERKEELPGTSNDGKKKKRRTWTSCAEVSYNHAAGVEVTIVTQTA